MKKFYIILLSAFVTIGYSQTTVFSENMGAPSTSPVTISANGFQNTTPILFSGTADIRTSSPSDTYPDASGNGCVFLGGSAPAKNLIIEGINTSNYSNLVLSFGHYKGTNAGSNELTVQVSEDGTTWASLTYTRATGAGTSVWTYITASGIIPSTNNLRIKFENPVSNVGFRIDDVKLTGTTLGIKQNSIAGLKVYPNPITNKIFFVETNANSEKTIVIFDVLGKQVLKTITTENAISVANLNSGVYIVKITEEGKTASRKLVIK